MNLFDQPLTLESLLSRIEALEARVLDKPVRQCVEVPPEIREAWGLWYLHKAGSKNWSAIAKRKQIGRLMELSGGNSNMARLIVEQSIERGWTGFFELKQSATVTPITKPVKEAMKPQESKLERDIARARQDYHYGVIDQAERDRRIHEATSKHRSAG